MTVCNTAARPTRQYGNGRSIRLFPGRTFSTVARHSADWPASEQVAASVLPRADAGCYRLSPSLGG